MDSCDFPYRTLNLVHAEHLRLMRDEIVLKWQNGEIRSVADVERHMNETIRALGVETITGDTTI